MMAVGIDIGKCRHAVAGVDGTGGTLCRSAFYENTRKDAERLLAVLAKVAPCETSGIGMEATSSHWFALHDFLVKAGYRVDVINPIVSSASIAGDIRGRKTDKGDAVAIARVVLRGETSPRQDADSSSRRLMALTRHRAYLVEQRSGTKRHVQSLLDVVFPEFHTLFETLYSTFTMELLRRCPTARALSRARRSAVVKLVSDLTRGRDAEDEADRLVNAAKGSLAAGSGVADAYGTCIRSSVGMILGLDEAIAEIGKEIGDFETPGLATTISKIKGAGKLPPRVIASEFGDIARFEVSPKTGRKAGMYKRLLAYAGAEPRIRVSGGWRGQAHVSRRGSGSLRTALFQLAFCISRNDDHFRTVYERQIDRGKHHNVALSYVMADFLRIVCSLWKSGREYTVKNPNASKTVA